MLNALLVDGLLILILILLVPIGAYRGGVREVCSAAGVLLGLLLVEAWAERWGSRVADISSLGNNTAQFVTSVVLLFLATVIVGYGAGTSFSYSPGPGGRLYGAILSFVSGLIFLGAVIGYVQRYLFRDVVPEVIDRTYVARGLASGMDWVMLGVALALTLATLFGAIVRERDYDDALTPQPRAPAIAPARSAAHASIPEPVKIEPSPESSSNPTQRTTAIRIKEVRHWEEPTLGVDVPDSVPGSGWTQTWPEDKKSPGAGRPPAGSNGNRRTIRRSDSGESESAALRDWLAEETNGKTGDGRRKFPGDE